MSEGKRSGLRRGMRVGLPFAVSVAFIAWVLQGQDVAAVVSAVTPRVLAWFVPGLLAFLAITLYIEAICLMIVVRDHHGETHLLEAARMKAASYLLAIVNYALGAGAVSILLRRRTSLSLSDAAGVVLLIGLFDLGSLLLAASVCGMLLGSEGTGVRLIGVAVAMAAIVAGFVVLRAPQPLGPLDRLRDLEIFRAARTVSAACLAKLGVLRAAFIATFILLSWTTMNAFAVYVPWLELVVKVSLLLLVSAIPIAVAGLGTGQAVFVELFRDHAPSEVLLAASLTLSFGLIVSRAIIGGVFAREFTREAWKSQQELDAEAEAPGEASGSGNGKQKTSGMQRNEKQKQEGAPEPR